MVAEVCGLKAKELIMTFGDVHIYKNHISQLLCQVENEPKPCPRIRLAHKECIDDFTPEDIELVGYEHYEKIKLELAL